VSNNIHHYTIKNSTEAVGPINDLIELSRYKPQPTYPNARPDQIRQFIIIDELENATAELISRLLEPLENGNSSTSWVLCTMDLNKLKKRNPAVAEAIISRCTLLEFNALSEEYISNCLHKTYSELNLSDEARLAIAKLAEGNLRKAHDLVSNISLLTSTEGVDITEQFINETFLGGFTIDNRKKFWKALCLSDKDNMVNSLNLYCRNADPKLIANILVEDLITYSTLNQIPSDTINLLRDLSMWFTNPLTPLCWVFFPYLGCKLF
jgi:DNA polymerase III delta prime subunit